MKLVTVDFASASPHLQSLQVAVPKLKGELDDDYERRCWRAKVHCDAQGNCFIPPSMFRNALSDAARYRSEKIGSKGKETWTKHFDAGILMIDEKAIDLKTKRDTPEMMAKRPFASSPSDTPGIMQGVWMSVSPQGKSGPGPRVMKCFPIFQEWSGTVRFLIVDDLITELAFTNHLQTAGLLIGVGSFRPRNRGWSGRFNVKKIVWQDDYQGEALAV